MEKIIKILVDSEEQAFQISQELAELDQNDTLSIAESFILSKDANGEVSLKDAKNRKPISYTLGGALAGSLLGMLGGPLGILWGATLGLMAGAAGDILDGEQTSDYLERAGKTLPDGKVALLIHLDEYWTTPVDTIAKKYEASVTRYDVDEEIDAYIQRELNYIDERIEEVSKEVNENAEEANGLLHQKLDDLKKKREALWLKIKEKTGAQKKQYQKWLDKIQLKFQDIKEDIQDEIEEFKEDISEEIDEIKEELAIDRKKRLKKQITRQQEKLAKLEERLGE